MEKRQMGYSLIELMIAMTLGLLLLSFILTIFQSIRNSSNYTNNLIAIQEIGRSVFQLFQRDLANTKEIINPILAPPTVREQADKTAGLLFLSSKGHKIVYYLSVEKQKNKVTFELNRRDLGSSLHNQTAMLEGLKDFKLTYGKLKFNNVHFVPATEINNWPAVKLMKVSFIATSKKLERPFEFILRVGKNV